MKGDMDSVRWLVEVVEVLEVPLRVFYMLIMMRMLVMVMVVG